MIPPLVQSRIVPKGLFTWAREPGLVIRAHVFFHGPRSTVNGPRFTARESEHQAAIEVPVFGGPMPRGILTISGSAGVHSPAGISNRSCWSRVASGQLSGVRRLGRST